jgi:hypothetical protein
VIDSLEVVGFFARLNLELPAAKQCKDSSLDNIKKVLLQNHTFTKEYLRLPNSFYEIVSSISAIGFSIDNPKVVTMLGAIIASKVELSQVKGAWEQYVHLADWLIYLASILEIGGTSIEGPFLDAVQFSMKNMSKELLLGYCWQAYRSWSSKWDGIGPANRAIIRSCILKTVSWKDAIAIVSLS